MTHAMPFALATPFQNVILLIAGAVISAFIVVCRGYLARFDPDPEDNDLPTLNSALLWIVVVVVLSLLFVG